VLVRARCKNAVLYDGKPYQFYDGFQDAWTWRRVRSDFLVLFPMLSRSLQWPTNLRRERGGNSSWRVSA